MKLNKKVTLIFFLLFALLIIELGLYYVGRRFATAKSTLTKQERAYSATISPVKSGDKYFFWDEEGILTPEAAVEIFRKGFFSPLENGIGHGHDPPTKLWVYLIVDSSEYSKINVVCLKENDFAFSSPFKTNFYQIIQQKAEFLAYSGAKCNRYRKNSPFEYNDYCVPFKQNKASATLDFLIKVEKQRRFRPTIFPYLSDNVIEEEFEIRKKYEQRHQRAFLMIFVCILTYFFIYILIQYWQVRDVAYLWYALYLFGLILYHGEQLDERYRVQWIFSHIVEWHDYFRAFLHAILGASYAYFVIHFLDFKKSNFKIYRLINRLMFINFTLPIVAIFVGLFASPAFVTRLIRNYNVLLIALVIYILYVILKSKAQQKQRYQRLYDYIILGTAAIMIGGIINYSLRYLDQTDWFRSPTIWNRKINYVRFGILIENIFFLLGLSYKARLMIEDKTIYETKMQYFEKQVEEFRQQALRARIPAHTATNILKDIKTLHEQNKHKKAEQFSNLFSSFLRQHYEQSLEKYIPLSKELTSIQTYIKLRSIAPEKTVQFLEEYEGVDLDYYYIPPGILFPVVENSINHAFIHHSDNQHISISIKEMANEQLSIAISDNGRGRDASEKRETTKKSTGLLSIKAICEQEGIDFNIIDNIPTGTTILFRFKNEVS